MAAQLLVFPVGPTGQRSIQWPHRRIERRAIIPPVGREPPSNLRVEHPGPIFDPLVAPEMEVPASNLRPNRLHRLVGNRRAKIDEGLSESILRPPRTKRVAEKIELLVRIRPSPIIILAIDDLRLLQMKFQPAFPQACGYGLPNLLGFGLRPAMPDGLLGVPFERYLPIRLRRPPIKGLVQEQIG